MTTGIYNTGYNDYFYNNQYGNYNSGGYLVDKTNYNNQQISFTSDKTEELAKKRKKIEKDDGNIGFFKAAKNFVKGVGKFFTGMFTDEKGNFSLLQTLKTAAIAVGVGAVCVLTAGTAVPAMIAAAGVGVSALGMGKAAINIATADTDAEAEAAWQSLGSNTTAAGLAVMGAKAVAKSAPGAKAADFDGITGAGKAVKQVFSDSGKAISESYGGIKTAFKGAPSISRSNLTGSLKGKYDAVKGEVGKQYSEFAGKVKNNYNNAVYGTKGKIDNESKAIDKEIKDIETKQSKISDKTSKEYKELETKKAVLETKRDAINQVNEAKSWEDAQAKIKDNKEVIQECKQYLEENKANLTKEQIKTANENIAKLEEIIKTQEQVLARRTSEAQHLRNQIDKKNKQIEELKKQDTPDNAKISKLEQEIADLKAKQEFEIPTNEVTAEQVKTSNENVPKLQKEAAEAQKKYEQMDIESFTNDRAYAQLETFKQKANAAKEAADAAKAENITLNQKYAVQEGKGELHAVTEIGQVAYKDPASRWLTVGIAGRQFGISNPYADFYSQLNAQEKAYFKSLPEEQKAALIEQYNNLVA